MNDTPSRVNLSNTNYVVTDNAVNNYPLFSVFANGRHFNIPTQLFYNSLTLIWEDVPNVYNQSRNQFDFIHNNTFMYQNIPFAKSILKKYKIGKCKEECGLCGETVDSKMYRLSCGHTFHVRCEVSLSKWVDKCHTEGRDSTCPMCRSLIE